MTMTRGPIARILAAAIVLGLAAAGFLAWAKSPYGQTEAAHVAQDFVSKLRSEDDAGAFELTVKGGHIGESPAELRRHAERHPCLSDRFSHTFPPQTNGNRLRRRVRGQVPDMDEINVEFEGRCLLGVKLRRTTEHGWRVVHFGSHAG